VTRGLSMPAALKVAIFNLLTELREYWTAAPTPYALGHLDSGAKPKGKGAFANRAR